MVKYIARISLRVYVFFILYVCERERVFVIVDLLGIYRLWLVFFRVRSRFFFVKREVRLVVFIFGLSLIDVFFVG